MTEIVTYIIGPLAINRINLFINAMNTEILADPSFYKEVLEHPLNAEIFLGGVDQVETLRQGRAKGHARGAFGHQ